MLSYGVYAAIMFGSIAIIVLLGAIILLKMPLPRLVTLLESIFRFKQVRNIGNDIVVIDVCDDKFELINTMSSRLPFVFALGMC